MAPTDDQGQRRDEKTRRSQDKRRRLQEWRVRWRWPSTLLLSLNLCLSAVLIWEKRAQWSGLWNLHSLTQFRDFGSIEWNIFGFLVWSLTLVQTWLSVSEYRREQARVDQERRYRAAALEEGVWPPPPNRPPA